MGAARYTVVIEWDNEGDLYVATLPALSVGGCGVSMDEGIPGKAAQVTIEGLKADNLPVPKSEEGTTAHLNMAV